MSRLADLLVEVSGLLGAAGVRFVLVGGLAVSVRTEPRFTRDISLVVAVDDDLGAEAAVASLVPPFSVVQVLEHDILDRLATVRLGRLGGVDVGVVVDLLFASSGIEAEVVADATDLEVLPGVIVPVAGTGHLIAQKLLSRSPDRPQDDVDLHALLGVAEAADRRIAEEALRSIVERGAHRGRRLLADWAQLQAQQR